MIDIDHFTAVNDGHGHAAGDEALKRVSRLLSECAGPSDRVARWGGEEFLIVFETTDAAAAEAAAERLRVRAAGLDVTQPDGRSARFTVSIGLATWHDGEPTDALIARADRSLYRAKAEGRNRVVAS